MTTIPASELVAVNPSVLEAGGSGVDVVGLILTPSTMAPLGTVLSFPDGAAVTDYFGAGSTEDIVANGAANRGSGYFGGYANATKLPASMLVARYNAAAAAGYIRSGDVAAVLTLAQLQALSGSLNIVVDGNARNAASINLSAATSFSSAASIIQTGLNAAIATIASFTGVIAGNVLTASAVTGVIAVGQTVKGAGVDAGLYIIALGTGTGGAGTYTLSGTDTVSSVAMTTEATPVAVSFDSVSGGFTILSGVTGAASTVAFPTGTLAASILLTSATGAVLSQGAAAAVPAAFMNALVATNPNWVTFMTAFDPDGGSGNTVKQAFAAWKNSKNNRFAYVCFDTDVTPGASVPASASLGQILKANGDSGTCLIDGEVAAGWGNDMGISTAAFICGAAASIDFSEKAGRISFAYKSSTGLLASVTGATVATNLGGDPQTVGSFGNGYNFYGAYGTANPTFTWFQRGLVTGDFRWLDAYINQVWLNNAFQVATLNYLGAARSVPYGAVGNSMIESALADPIQAGLNFGAFGPGTLTAAQIATVNGMAGTRISDTLQTQGYYLQILTAAPTTRASRASPPCKFWYIDQGSVQAISLASIALT